MTGITFLPLVPFWLLAALGAALVLAVAFASWRRLPGAAIRALAGALLIAALAGPVLEKRELASQDDIFLILLDKSSSQDLSDRPEQSARALRHLRGALDGRGRIEVVAVSDAPEDGGTRLVSALSAALADLPAGQVAGIFVISDGQIHDADLTPDLPAPLHLLQTGHKSDWDRRIHLLTAPVYGIIGEDVTLSLRIEDQGAAPGSAETDLTISVDGGPAQSFRVPLGEDLSLPFRLPHAGDNVLRLEIPEAAGELTDRNNTAVIRVNGIRDRLRVMLVSGEPHAGERTWRNLLKSDSSVDLVHFTILRPPEKLDATPPEELSLIAFPTRELFLEKIDDFDLIVFDRYRRRGILPVAYIENIRRYVEDGGAVLVAAGPAYAGVDSLYRSPLGDIMPGAPTARVVEQPFSPKITDTGARHPVTRGLEGGAEWGRWLRLIEVTPKGGEVLMTGAEGRPLLIVDRVGEGRVALLASDHAWLWDRGYEGGGPQLELLRRIAHWAMKEPDLEEESLTALPKNGTLAIRLQTLGDAPGPVTVDTPSGDTLTVMLDQTGPGTFTASIRADQQGIYRLTAGGLTAVVATGPAAPREMAQTIASADLLVPAIATRAGGAFPIEEGLPRLRETRPGRIAAGRGWAGITPRESTLVIDLSVTPLLPVWLWLILTAGLMVWAWIREGR